MPDSENKCNCRRTADCPLQGKCLEHSLIYQATVKTPQQTESYIGLTANEFKTRYRNHLASFRHLDKKASTELSSFTWDLKERNIDYTIEWKIMMKAKTINNNNNRCSLCTAEKYYIITQPHTSTLNERRDLVTTCRHIRGHLVCTKQKDYAIT